ncbi:MAG: ferritin-like domain-containing protein [Caldilineaceae bacterium]|nr:ferritin-like domain-containing protein [Caldilineaceae bacterium]
MEVQHRRAQAAQVQLQVDLLQQVSEAVIALDHIHDHQQAQAALARANERFLLAEDASNGWVYDVEHLVRSLGHHLQVGGCRINQVDLGAGQFIIQHHWSTLPDGASQAAIDQCLAKAGAGGFFERLKKAFQNHLDETRTQKQRLEQIFSELGSNPQGETCKAMQGLLKEGEDVMQATGDPQVKDAALIAAAQRVEHYEIAGYGTVRTYADELGFSNAKSLLQKTLDEEGEANKKLNSIAEGGLFRTGINEKALAH